MRHRQNLEAGRLRETHVKGLAESDVASGVSDLSSDKGKGSNGGISIVGRNWEVL